MTEYKKGQRVKVEFEGVVKVADSDGMLEILTDDGYFYYIAARREPGVKITPADPKGWPPRVGDIWETGGTEYFARHSADKMGITMVPDGQDVIGHYALNSMSETFKALNPVLVRRRGQ